MSKKRIITDIRGLSKYDDIIAVPDDNNVFKCDACIMGPIGTIWEGAVLRLSVEFDSDYPTHPPKVRFLSNVFHPNIYKDGKICLDILNAKEWKPIYSLGHVLLSIRSLLSDPNPQDPANIESARLFTRDRHVYEMKVRECVRHTWITPYDV